MRRNQKEYYKAAGAKKMVQGRCIFACISNIILRARKCNYMSIYKHVPPLANIHSVQKSNFVFEIILGCNGLDFLVSIRKCGISCSTFFPLYSQFIWRMYYISNSSLPSIVVIKSLKLLNLDLQDNT